MFYDIHSVCIYISKYVIQVIFLNALVSDQYSVSALQCPNIREKCWNISSLAHIDTKWRITDPYLPLSWMQSSFSTMVRENSL